MKVFINYIRRVTGEPKTVVVHAQYYNDTLGVLKQKIYNKNRTLRMESQVLSPLGKPPWSKWYDRRSLYQLGITSNCVLNLVLEEPGNETNVKVRADGEVTNVKVQLNGPVRLMKENVWGPRGPTPLFMQSCTFKGTELENHHTLTHYNIQENSTLDLSVSKNNGPRFKVLTKCVSSGAIFYIYIRDSDTASDVKRQVYDATGILPDEQNLVYNGRYIPDQAKALDYIQVHSFHIATTLTMFVLPRPPDFITINVKTMINQVVAVHIDRGAKVEELKPQIEALVGMPREQQKFKRSREVLLLQEERSLSEQGITTGSWLQVALCVTAGNALLVRTDPEHTLTLGVKPYFRVRELKTMLERLGIPECHLEFFGVGLEHSQCKLSCYCLGVRPMQLVHLTREGPKKQTTAQTGSGHHMSPES